MPDDRERAIARVQNQGYSLASLLTVLFVGLKLTGYITWSWWWVLAPYWFPLAVALAVCVVALFAAVVLAVLK